MPKQYNRENNRLNVAVFIQVCQPFNCTFSYDVGIDRCRVARILSGGALFWLKKVDDLFLVVTIERRYPNLTRPAKMS